MNTKTSKTDTKKLTQAEIEDRDAETRINIVRMQIVKMNALLLSYGEKPEEYYIDVKTRLEREKKELQRLKNKYPEYFI